MLKFEYITRKKKLTIGLCKIKKIAQEFRVHFSNFVFLGGKFSFSGGNLIFLKIVKKIRFFLAKNGRKLAFLKKLPNIL